MEPAQVLWALFYLWLLVAVGVWIWRGYRRIAHHETRRDREARRAQGPDGPRVGADPAQDTATRADRPRPAGSGTPAGIAAGDAPLAEGSLVREAIRAELAERERAASAGDEADVGAPAADDGERRGVFARREPARRPVAEMLQGIAMPCGLIPLVTDSDIDPHHVVFATTEHDAPAVGAALADELERLGFAVRSVSDTEALARRDADELRVVVHPTTHDGAARFPTAPPAAVVVELAS